MKYFLVVLSIITILWACQKEEALTPNEDANGLVQIPPGSGNFGGGSGGGSGGAGGGSTGAEFFNFVVDGTAYNSSNPQYIESGSQALITSDLVINDFIQLAFFTTNLTVPDTMVLDTFTSTVSFYRSASEQYTPKSGQLIIEELDANKMVGKFDFTGELFRGSTDTVVVTNGTFSVNR